ncbi:molybdopterin-dependent oxidoreductase [Paraburkholderia sp. 31.1]|nr:molybdopterin-dependent oxidoreductase [Paraburkholderia sp. 31.1]
MDTESTNGAYAGFEGTPRRLWAKELGIEFVHIDPHCNPTAQLLGGRWIPVRPQTDAALATAIMYVWAVEGLYDEDYIATRTTGFDEWRAYLLGETDGVPKTPEWQEGETGVPAKDVRALAINPDPMHVEANSVNAFRPTQGSDITAFGFRVYAVLGYEQDDGTFKKGRGNAFAGPLYGAVLSAPSDAVESRVRDAGSNATVRMVIPLLLTAVVCSPS